MSTGNAEQQLIDILRRIEPMRTGSTAFLVKISALHPANRSRNHIQTTLSVLNETLSNSRSNLLQMTNGDIVFVGHNISQTGIAEAASVIRRTFAQDTFATANPNEFIKIYALGRDYDTVMKYAVDSSKTNEPKAQKNEVPLAPEHLDAILRNIHGFNILKIIRRQEAVGISSKGMFESLFLEYFTSMADLKKAIAPDVDVLSNKWLFQHLSETLDKRMLGSYNELFAHTPKNISLNLNISTLFTTDFEQFLTKIPQGGSLVVEVSLMDIMQNTPRYLAAKDLLHEAGHRILIDGLHPISFRFIDMAKLDSDLMKLNWTPELNNEDNADCLQGIDSSRVILMRCENEDSLRWGLMHGVRQFQGYFMDALTSAKVRRFCAYRADCSASKCSFAKSVIAATLRSYCRSQDRLDHPFEFKETRP